jgi:uncharacterized protein (DUF1697 family)
MARLGGEYGAARQVWRRGSAMMGGVPTYIALLRALNVGGRYYKMADLRDHLTESGLDDVETYIQTGNVRFRSSMRSAAKVEKHVEEVLGEHCRFDVPAVIFSPQELRQVYDDALGLAKHDPDGARRYVTFFKVGAAPTGDVARQIAAWDEPGESAVVIGRAAHIQIVSGMHDAKFFAVFKKALFPGTNRDLKVVKAMAGRWAG